jgi:hypothetical protein
VGWGGEVLGHWGVLVLMNGIHVFFAALREGSVGLSHCVSFTPPAFIFYILPEKQQSPFIYYFVY